MSKSRDAFRTISEVADWLETPAHVLRFWESKFSQVKPVKRAGGRRYYRPADMELLGGIKKLLHDDGMTIKGVQKILREQGVRHVAALCEQRVDEEDGALIEDAPYAEVDILPGEGTVVTFHRGAAADAPVDPAEAAEDPDDTDDAVDETAPAAPGSTDRQPLQARFSFALEPEPTPEAAADDMPDMAEPPAETLPDPAEPEAETANDSPEDAPFSADASADTANAGSDLPEAAPGPEAEDGPDAAEPALLDAPADPEPVGAEVTPTDDNAADDQPGQPLPEDAATDEVLSDEGSGTAEPTAPEPGPVAAEPVADPAPDAVDTPAGDAPTPETVPDPHAADSAPPPAPVAASAALPSFLKRPMPGMGDTRRAGGDDATPRKGALAHLACIRRLDRDTAAQLAAHLPALRAAAERLSAPLQR